MNGTEILRSGSATRARGISSRLLLALLLTPSAAWPQPTNATAPFLLPGVHEQVKLQRRFASGRPVRITAQGVTQVVTSPMVTSQGVEWMEHPADGATPPAPAHLVQWSELERIQTQGNSAGVGATTGAIVLGLLTLGAGLSVQDDSILGGNEAGLMAAVGGGAVLGAGIGALVGLGIPKWVNVHVGQRTK